jgi:hypothetical protein
MHPKWQVSCQDQIGDSLAAAEVDSSLEESKTAKPESEEDDQIFEIVTSAGDVVPLDGFSYLVDEETDSLLLEVRKQGSSESKDREYQLGPAYISNFGEFADQDEETKMSPSLLGTLEQGVIFSEQENSRPKLLVRFDCDGTVDSSRDVEISIPIKD